jgi:hypothetical protein
VYQFEINTLPTGEPLSIIARLVGAEHTIVIIGQSAGRALLSRAKPRALINARGLAR